jgi:hypothetical protein
MAQWRRAVCAVAYRVAHLLRAALLWVGIGCVVAQALLSGVQVPLRHW